MWKKSATKLLFCLSKIYLSRYFSAFDNDQLGNIYKHYWKECLQFSEIAEFESDGSYMSYENFTDICMMGGHKHTPTIQTSVKCTTLRSYICVSFHQITLKLGNFTNFKALFSAKLMDFT